MSSAAEVVRGLPYFAGIEEELIASIVDRSQMINVPEGTVIIEEGSASEEMYVVVEGDLLVTKHSADKEVTLARLGPGEVVGEIALLENATRNATVVAAKESALLLIPGDAFRHMLENPKVVLRMFRAVAGRLRNLEETLRHEERMAALGKMAAQLMHELNNPAAAVGRSTSELKKVYTDLSGESAHLVGTTTDSVSLASVEGQTKTMSSLDRAEAEEALAGWLRANGVDDPWSLAPALVQGGWNVTRLVTALGGVSEESLSHMARWLGLRLSADQLIDEISIGAGRISELVRVVKEYSYLDRAPVQFVDIEAGIRDTLILLKHKLREIEVVFDVPEELPTVEAPGRDLNQVWTNIIDNAADAMVDGGTLHIEVSATPVAVIVTIGDTGPGMPDAVAERIFDPFYTTKEPGKGTGLGMHTVHNVLSRLGGSVQVVSSGAGTSFMVSVPRTHPG